MSENVMDFTDLGKGVEFAFRGSNYEIPSYTKSQMTDLIKISEKLVAISRGLSEEERKKVDSGEIKATDIENLFETQVEMVVKGVSQVNNGEYFPLTTAQVEAWPWKLVGKLVHMINKQMGSINAGEAADTKNPT